MLRKLFDHLDIETDELMITLRNNEIDGHIPADDSQNTYAELTKLSCPDCRSWLVSATEEETRPIRDEFADTFTESRIADPHAALPGKSLLDVESPEFIETASPEVDHHGSEPGCCRSRDSCPASSIESSRQEP